MDILYKGRKRTVPRCLQSHGGPGGACGQSRKRVLLYWGQPLTLDRYETPYFKKMEPATYEKVDMSNVKG